MTSSNQKTLMVVTTLSETKSSMSCRRMDARRIPATSATMSEATSILWLFIPEVGVVCGWDEVPVLGRRRNHTRITRVPMTELAYWKNV